MEAKTQSIEETLEKHPGFSRKKPQAYEKVDPLRNEICFHVDVGMVVINSKKIRVLDMNSENYITLEPTCKINAMHGGIINSSGNLLAIQGNNQILLIALSDEAKLSFNEEKECREVRCKSHIIQLGPIYNNEVRKICWHPLSDTHIVVLTNDSLRLYNCHVSTTEPEQTFYLTDAVDPISFSFGGSSYLDSWQRFTIFLLMRSGHIYAICPVVPYDCMIPVEYLSMLQDQMREKDDDNALRWLKEIKGPNIKVDFRSPLGIKRVNKRGNSKSRFSPVPSPSKTRKAFSANFDSDEESTEEEPEEQEKGFIRTKKPNSFNNTLTVQGPLTEHGNTTKFVCTDILTLPTLPIVILRAFEDALIEVFLLFEDIQPKWGREKMFKKHTDQASLLLYDNIDLGLPTHNSDMGPCRLFIAPNNSANNYEFYAYHGAGIHRIKLSYMSLLADSVLLDPSRLEKESIPPSEKSWILNTLPLGTGTGVRPIVLVGIAVANVKGKTLVVARDAEAKIHCVSDSVAQVLKKFNNLSENISPQTKGMNIEFPQMVPDVKNLHFEKESQAIVYLIHQTEERMKNQLPALHKIELQLKDQLKSVSDSYKEQQALLAASIEKKSTIAERYEKIQETINQVQQVQNDLTERLNRAMNTTMLLQKNLTKAEMRFHEELIGLKIQTNNQEQEVKQLSKQLEGLDFKENIKDEMRQIPKSKERKVAQIMSILEQESDLLLGMQEQTNDLKSEVSKLYGLSVL